MSNWETHGLRHLSDRFYKKNRENFLKLIEPDGGDKRLLDIGCADGTFTRAVAEKIGCTRMAGVEIDKNLVKCAHGNDVGVILFDANRTLPFINNCFDVVISNQVLEHLTNVDNMFREVSRILKDDGYCVFSTPNLASLHNVFCLMLGMQPPSYQVSEVQVGNFLKGVKTHGHKSVLTLPALRDLLSHHGFKIEKILGRRYSYFIVVKFRKAGDAKTAGIPRDEA